MTSLNLPRATVDTRPHSYSTPCSPYSPSRRRALSSHSSRCDCGCEEANNIFSPTSLAMFATPTHHQTETTDRNNLDKYEPLATIGCGSFGKIVRIRQKSTGKSNLVWKELQYGKMSDFEKKQIVSEVNILRTLSFRNHPHIIRYHGRIVDTMNTRVFIIMDHCSNGDLSKVIHAHRQNGTRMDEGWIWKIMGQIVSALAECHRTPCPILHRDLKPANILLDANMNCKICDFGLATEVEGGTINVDGHEMNNSSVPYVTDEIGAQVACGTPLYMAPEKMNNIKYDDRSDVWSLGCIIYEMASLKHPFEAEDEKELRGKVNKGDMMEIPTCYSSELNNTCFWLLRTDVTRRPRVQEIQRLPQLQLTLREIRCEMQESSLGSKRASLRQQLNDHMNMVTQREKDFQDREARLLEMENVVQERERRMYAWEEWNKIQSPTGVRDNVKPVHVVSGSSGSRNNGDSHVIEPNSSIYRCYSGSWFNSEDNPTEQIPQPSASFDFFPEQHHHQALQPRRKRQSDVYENGSYNQESSPSNKRIRRDEHFIHNKNQYSTVPHQYHIDNHEGYCQPRYR